MIFTELNSNLWDEQCLLNNWKKTHSLMFCFITQDRYNGPMLTEDFGEISIISGYFWHTADFTFDLWHTTHYILSKSLLYNMKHSRTKLMVKTQDTNSILDPYTTRSTSNTPCLLVLYVNSCLKIHEQWPNNAQWGYERQRCAFYDWQNRLRHQFRRYLVRQGQAICFK